MTDDSSTGASIFNYIQDSVNKNKISVSRGCEALYFVLWMVILVTGIARQTLPNSSAKTRETVLYFHIYAYIWAERTAKADDRGIMVREKDRHKFVALANKRVAKALHDIQLIGNLSNRSNYHYTEDDVAKMFKALNAELKACRRRFDLALNNKENSQFSLED